MSARGKRPEPSFDDYPQDDLPHAGIERAPPLLDEPFLPHAGVERAVPLKPVKKKP